MLKHLFAAAAATIIMTGAASAVTVTIDATDSIYGTNNTNGTAPVMYTFAAGSGNVLSFSSVTGLVRPNPNDPQVGPDGGSLYAPSNFSALNGISGLYAPSTLFLAGVFVDSANLWSGPAPEVIDFVALGIDFASLSPLLNQAFFIGDGLTGTGSGSTQSFIAPEGADTLLLGFADGAYFNGVPCYYRDNSGSLSASFTIAPVSAVPLPAALPMLAGALVAFGGLVRLGRRCAAPTVA